MAQIRHTHDFTIDQPVDVLFPLFSAEGEKLWVPGWDYEDVGESKELHEDYVFRTTSHDHGTASAVWIIKRYEPADHHVQMYKVEPDDKVGIITVQCLAVAEHRTCVEVTYEYIGLSDSGNAFIDGFTEAQYHAFIGEWKDLLVRYFECSS